MLINVIVQLLYPNYVTLRFEAVSLDKFRQFYCLTVWYGIGIILAFGAYLKCQNELNSDYQSVLNKAAKRLPRTRGDLYRAVGNG